MGSSSVFFTLFDIPYRCSICRIFCSKSFYNSFRPMVRIRVDEIPGRKLSVPRPIQGCVAISRTQVISDFHCILRLPEINGK